MVNISIIKDRKVKWMFRGAFREEDDIHYDVLYKRVNEYYYKKFKEELSEDKFKDYLNQLISDKVIIENEHKTINYEVIKKYNIDRTSLTYGLIDLILLSF